MRGMHPLHAAWELSRDTILAFLADNALSRGAALAYYSIFSLAPVLLIAIAVAGLLFGRAAAEGAVVRELSGQMGKESAQALQSLLQGAFFHRGSGYLATVIGVVTLLVTATGVFVEMQSSLNAIWKAEPASFTTMELIRARMLSLTLVAALAFLMVVSMLLSAALHAASTYAILMTPQAQTVLNRLDLIFSFGFLSIIFAAIFKVLPDRWISWRDVAIGAIVTAVLFNIGKYGISFYVGSSAIASAYGSAGSLIVLLVWIYYSAQTFLLGAEFTKVYAIRRGRFAMR